MLRKMSTQGGDDFALRPCTRANLWIVVDFTAVQRVKTYTRCASATLSKREEDKSGGENMLACVRNLKTERQIVESIIRSECN